MGLSISYRRPKYTPPKVCKKATTVLLPSWQAVDCPDVETITMRVTWPDEPFALSTPFQAVYKLQRTSPCRWEKFGIVIPAAHGTGAISVEFITFGPFLQVDMLYTWDPGRDYGYTQTFGDYDSRKPRLLLPSIIPPDTSTQATAPVQATITI
jgi:hypothetical protein